MDIIQAEALYILKTAMLLLVVTMTSANNTAGTIYGLRSQIQFSGSGTFMRNKAGMDYGRNCNGTAIHVEFSSISLSGYFKFCKEQFSFITI